jgi:hypothetical protein
MSFRERLSDWWAELRGSDTPEQINWRSVLFPDFGLRSISEQLSASFDPFNFAVRTARNPDTAEERDILRAGDFEKLKHIATSKVAGMTPEEETKYVFDITSEVHELRHCHEHFGTTYGFSRLWATIQDAIAFNKLWDELKREPTIKLPLIKWGQSPDAPAALKSYLSARRNYVEWFNVYDGVMDQKFNFNEQLNSNIKEPVQAIAVIHVGGLSTSVPLITLNFRSEATGQPIQKMFPLGGSLLMEGTAFVIQRKVASRVFGEEHFERLKNALRRMESSDDQMPRYMALDLHMTKHLVRFYDRYQLALSDVAMMNVEGDDSRFEDTHPGWRFWHALAAATSDPAVHRSQEADLEEYMNKITQQCGWPSVKEVARQAIDHWEKYLAKIDKSKEADTFWFVIARAAVKMHLDWMRIREKFPTILAEPLLYTKLFSKFAPPPVYQGRDGLVFGGLSDEDARAFRAWFLFEHFQRQLLFSSWMPCPGELIHKHKCPGDPLKRWKWKPTDQCPFSHQIQAFGIRERRFVAA